MKSWRECPCRNHADPKICVTQSKFYSNIFVDFPMYVQLIVKQIEQDLFSVSKVDGWEKYIFYQVNYEQIKKAFPFIWKFLVLSV